MESLLNRSDVYVLNGVGNNSSQSILNTINFRKKKKNFQRTVVKPCSEIVRCIRLSWGGSSFLPSNIPWHHLQTSRELVSIASQWQSVGISKRTVCVVS